jgi:ABC-type lipoprotein export system ATPase subunit
MISNINVEDINHAMRWEKIANLEDKEFFAVSGKTGSGKSSLLTFLLGFEPVFERKGINCFLKHQ